MTDDGSKRYRTPDHRLSKRCKAVAAQSLGPKRGQVVSRVLANSLVPCGGVRKRWKIMSCWVQDLAFYQVTPLILDKSLDLFVAFGLTI